MTRRNWLLPLLCIDLALWFGGAVYFSFFAALELNSRLSLDEFGKAIGILFPPYFTLMAVCAVVALVLVWLELNTIGTSRVLSRLGRTSVIIGTAIAIANRVYFLPSIERIEQQMGPISKASPQMLAKFGMTHGISLGLDFIMILCVLATWIALGLSLVQTQRGAAA